MELLKLFLLPLAVALQELNDETFEHQTQAVRPLGPTVPKNQWPVEGVVIPHQP
jgi:hypothetical protein